MNGVADTRIEAEIGAEIALSGAGMTTAGMTAAGMPTAGMTTAGMMTVHGRLHGPGGPGETAGKVGGGGVGAALIGDEGIATAATAVRVGAGVAGVGRVLAVRVV